MQTIRYCSSPGRSPSKHQVLSARMLSAMPMNPLLLKFKMTFDIFGRAGDQTMSGFLTGPGNMGSNK